MFNTGHVLAVTDKTSMQKIREIHITSSPERPENIRSFREDIYEKQARKEADIRAKTIFAMMKDKDAVIHSGRCIMYDDAVCGYPIEDCKNCPRHQGRYE